MDIQTPKLLNLFNDLSFGDEILTYFDYFISLSSIDVVEQFLGYLVSDYLHKGGLYINTLDITKRASIINNAQFTDTKLINASEEIIVERVMNVTRWNATAMVINAGLRTPGIGGHLATFESIAVLYEIGFDYYWKGNDDVEKRDFVYFQGHSSPGVYARSYLEYRLNEEDLDKFRDEALESGLSSYPHPHLMPTYWEFPTVSLGLGALQGVSQAIWLKYLYARGIRKNNDQKVWVYLGDAEMEEPESWGLARMATRHSLNNLIFVVNCNLLGLDGPVYGNGRIIDELNSIFHGYGWRVVKALWDFPIEMLLRIRNNQDETAVNFLTSIIDGDTLRLEADERGFIAALMDDYLPHLKEYYHVDAWSDLSNFSTAFFGGNSVPVVHATYKRALNPRLNFDSPTAFLARTEKGWGFDRKIKAAYDSHSKKKLSQQQIFTFSQSLGMPFTAEELKENRLPYFRFDKESEEYKFIIKQREKLNGFLPKRDCEKIDITIPDFDCLQAILRGSGDRSISTTMAFGLVLTTLFNQKSIKDHINIITTDEARTFGIEPLFNKVGIYDPHGQKFVPTDEKSILKYRMSKTGQFFEMGINEIGAASLWLIAATSYANHKYISIPFIIYYSIFGYQRFGDMVWASADSHAKGFVIGATAGRTTLNGEGLQHQDGHNLVMWSYIPHCNSYDPAYGYELAIIIHHGLVDMFEKHNPVFYYITVMNENYLQPPMPIGVEFDIIKGMYLLLTNQAKKTKGRINLFGSGTILNEVILASELLSEKYSVSSEVFSVTSYGVMRKECEQVNRLRIFQGNTTKKSHVEKRITNDYPIIAASDYIKANAEQIRQHISNDYYVLGTDGLGRSGSRADLRTFFEVDRFTITFVSLYALSKKNPFFAEKLKEFIKEYKFDIKNKKNPLEC